MEKELIMKPQGAHCLGEKGRSALARCRAVMAVIELRAVARFSPAHCPESAR
jgi:hypothetical protein